MTHYQITIAAAHNGNARERVYTFELLDNLIKSTHAVESEFDQVDHVAEEIADAINNGNLPAMCGSFTLTQWDTNLPLEIIWRARAI